MGAPLRNDPETGWLSYGFNLATTTDANGNTVDYRIGQVIHPAERALAWESNQWNITTGAGSIQGTYAPRHQGTPAPNNTLGQAGTFLFLDGHAALLVMPMTPTLSLDRPGDMEQSWNVE